MTHALRIRLSLAVAALLLVIVAPVSGQVLESFPCLDQNRDDRLGCLLGKQACEAGCQTTSCIESCDDIYGNCIRPVNQDFLQCLPDLVEAHPADHSWKIYLACTDMCENVYDTCVTLDITPWTQCADERMVCQQTCEEEVTDSDGNMPF